MTLSVNDMALDDVLFCSLAVIVSWWLAFLDQYSPSNGGKKLTAFLPIPLLTGSVIFPPRSTVQPLHHLRDPDLTELHLYLIMRVLCPIEDYPTPGQRLSRTKENSPTMGGTTN